MEGKKLALKFEKNEAIKAMQTHLGNYILKVKRAFTSKQQLNSIELVYLPYWCYRYRFTTAKVKKPIEGRVAIEPTHGLSAILPENVELHDVHEARMGTTLLNVSDDPQPDKAKETVYWEVFSKEKKRQNIKVDILKTSLIYVPYWVGYLENDKLDIVAVDGTNGKVDLGVKEAILNGFLRM
ncbi:hypothetical protein [Alteribacter populi]|uniref:hypothetical protein n=1 Tax=Alteribacter populi TaxID=2011011 RepID=UPI000BBAC3AF|nr:hypothetical protein [Alteribacter populi]